MNEHVNKTFRDILNRQFGEVFPLPKHGPALGDIVSAEMAEHMVQQLNETGSVIMVGNKIVRPNEWYACACFAYGKTRCVACFMQERGDDYGDKAIMDRLSELQADLHLGEFK